jgi:hypothetical protein
MHQIYCFNNGGSAGWYIAAAVADDGHCLATHACSHPVYMRHDLGMDGSTWKHETYNKHFGAGNWELVWVDSPEDPRLKAALELNQKLAHEASH